MFKKIINKKVDIPVVGSISIKDGIRWVVLAVVAGVVIYGAVRLPVVGGYVATGINKVRGWFPWAIA